ncbi:MAG: anti-sigma factor [Chloroflexi bacterium]|nr:anti-sigma factor [Chloroflexota bacterium]
MATNNPNNESNTAHNSGHPVDMLEAFALDALDLDEELSIQDHLDNCDQCSDVVGDYQGAAAELAGAVNPQAPPAELRARVMQAISREEPPAFAAPEPQLVPSVGDRLIDSRLIRVLAPLAASAAIVLVLFAVTMNVRISNQVDNLKDENATLQASLDSNVATMTAQIGAATVADTAVMERVLKLQQASYELAQPDNMSLELHSPSAESLSQGILLVSNDGNRGVIMVAGMEPHSSAEGYNVWLMRGQDKVWVGQVVTDDRGWGTVSLTLPESIMDFEKVELTEGDNRRTATPPTDMVLEGNLVSMNTPRLVTYAPMSQFIR